MAATSWFVVRLTPALKIVLPAIVPADPGPVWAIFGMGCVLAAMILLSVREYGAKRYRSTVGVVAAGMTGLFFVIFSFVASHGWVVLSLKAAG